MLVIISQSNISYLTSTLVFGAQLATETMSTLRGCGYPSIRLHTLKSLWSSGCGSDPVCWGHVVAIKSQHWVPFLCRVWQLWSLLEGIFALAALIPFPFCSGLLGCLRGCSRSRSRLTRSLISRSSLVTPGGTGPAGSPPAHATVRRSTRQYCTAKERSELGMGRGYSGPAGDTPQLTCR